MTSRAGIRAGAVALFCGLLLTAGCGSAGGGSSPTALPEAARGGTALGSGPYRTTRFRPQTTFKVGDGWVTSSTEGIDYFDITRADAFETIVFQRVAKVASPKDAASIVAAPDDLPAWIRAHPSLDAGPPVKTTLAGLPATQIDATVKAAAPAKQVPSTCDKPCLPLFVPADGTPTSYEPGDKLRFIVTKPRQGLGVSVTIAAPEALFRRFLPMADDVLSTVKFGAV